ncbi:hypothetical protein H9Q70_008219 [Fusarium xylarioides]|nr:hypothetical protein H9Q70_008219 [Fusarium xylarioides]KAG5778084.1 hypothetical protein H9Q73_008243 [Fusarium xylarioides]
MPVTHIPLTALGKKDRQSIRIMLACVAVDQSQKMRIILGESEPSRPLTEREKDLQQLLVKILKLDSEKVINANANFFHSGGDSVRAMALVAAARREGTHLNVADIFNHLKSCDMAAITTPLSHKDQPAELASYSFVPCLYLERSLCQAIPRSVTFNRFVAHVSGTEDNLTPTFWRSYLEGVPMASFIQQATKVYKPTADNITSQDVSLCDNFTARSGVTVTSLVRAAWALVLATYNSGKTSDVVFGIVVGGRSLDVADIEYIDGPTIATVPFRVTFDPTAPVDMLLQGVQNKSTQIL